MYIPIDGTFEDLASATWTLESVGDTISPLANQMYGLRAGGAMDSPAAEAFDAFAERASIHLGNAAASLHALSTKLDDSAGVTLLADVMSTITGQD